jgi:hypothetical protein
VSCFGAWPHGGRRLRIGLAATVADAPSVLSTLAVECRSDASNRTLLADTLVAASLSHHRPSRPGDRLDDLNDARRAVFASVLAGLEAVGVTEVRINLSTCLQAGGSSTGWCFVAEPSAAVGAWTDSHRDLVDPSVGSIISAAGAARSEPVAREIEILAVSDRVLRDVSGGARRCRGYHPDRAV